MTLNGHGGPKRRADDVTDDPEADEIERFYGSLPKVIRWLRRTAWQNRIIAVSFAGFAVFSSCSDDRQNATLAESQRMDRIRAERICEDLTDNARKFNRLVDTIIKRTRENPTIPAEDKAEALRLYTSSRQTLPVCGPQLKEDQ